MIIAGAGAFAVENLQTVTVLGCRHGAVRPEAVDYWNFVLAWDAYHRHDASTNVKQFLVWAELYAASACTVPACWPVQV